MFGTINPFFIRMYAVHRLKAYSYIRDESEHSLVLVVAAFKNGLVTENSDIAIIQFAIAWDEIT